MEQALYVHVGKSTLRVLAGKVQQHHHHHQLYSQHADDGCTADARFHWTHWTWQWLFTVCVRCYQLQPIRQLVFLHQLLLDLSCPCVWQGWLIKNFSFSSKNEQDYMGATTTSTWCAIVLFSISSNLVANSGSSGKRVKWKWKQNKSSDDALLCKQTLARFLQFCRLLLLVSWNWQLSSIFICHSNGTT